MKRSLKRLFEEVHQNTRRLALLHALQQITQERANAEQEDAKVFAVLSVRLIQMRQIVGLGFQEGEGMQDAQDHVLVFHLHHSFAHFPGGQPAKSFQRFNAEHVARVVSHGERRFDKIEHLSERVALFGRVRALSAQDRARKRSGPMQIQVAAGERKEAGQLRLLAQIECSAQRLTAWPPTMMTCSPES